MAASGAAAAALVLDRLRKAYGGLHVTRDVSLSVEVGEVHALIGPNGAGKTSLVNQISGTIMPDGGRVLLGGQDVTRLSFAARVRSGLARTFQLTTLAPSLTVLETAALHVQARAPRARGRHLPLRPADGDPALEQPARAALERVGLEHRAAALAGTLSHGEKRLLEIAAALATAPRVLLLDEPLAGAGPEETGRLVDLLRQLKPQHAILLIEHDTHAVFALANQVTVLDGGAVIAQGTPDRVRAHPAVREAYLGEDALA